MKLREFLDLMEKKEKNMPDKKMDKKASKDMKCPKCGSKMKQMKNGAMRCGECGMMKKNPDKDA